MKNIEINGKTIALELLTIESDHETLGAWRNGIVILEDGTRIDCGGGWIENEESNKHSQPSPNELRRSMDRALSQQPVRLTHSGFDPRNHQPRKKTDYENQHH